jgi:hypothetical protein
LARGAAEEADCGARGAARDRVYASPAVTCLPSSRAAAAPSRCLADVTPLTPLPSRWPAASPRAGCGGCW